MTLIITTLATLLITALQSYGVIPSSLVTLLTTLAAKLPTLIASLSSGQGVSADVNVVLTSIQSEIADLKASGDADPAVLAEINALDAAVQAVLKADAAAVQTVDPDTLTDLAAL